MEISRASVVLKFLLSRTFDSSSKNGKQSNSWAAKLGTCIRCSNVYGKISFAPLNIFSSVFTTRYDIGVVDVVEVVVVTIVALLYSVIIAFLPLFHIDVYSLSNSTEIASTFCFICFYFSILNSYVLKIFYISYRLD